MLKRLVPCVLCLVLFFSFSVTSFADWDSSQYIDDSEFGFKVGFYDSQGVEMSDSFPMTVNDIYTDDVKSGDIIKLGAGDVAYICDVPNGVQYSFEEVEYDKMYYKPRGNTVVTGIHSENSLSRVLFENDFNEDGYLGGPEMPETGGTGISCFLIVGFSLILFGLVFLKKRGKAFLLCLCLSVSFLTVNAYAVDTDYTGIWIGDYTISDVNHSLKLVKKPGCNWNFGSGDHKDSNWVNRDGEWEILYSDWCKLIASELFISACVRNVGNVDSYIEIGSGFDIVDVSVDDLSLVHYYSSFSDSGIYDKVFHAGDDVVFDFAHFVHKPAMSDLYKADHVNLVNFRAAAVPTDNIVHYVWNESRHVLAVLVDVADDGRLSVVQNKAPEPVDNGDTMRKAHAWSNNLYINIKDNRSIRLEKRVYKPGDACVVYFDTYDCTLDFNEVLVERSYDVEWRSFEYILYSDQYPNAIANDGYIFLTDSGLFEGSTVRVICGDTVWIDAFPSPDDPDPGPEPDPDPDPDPPSGVYVPYTIYWVDVDGNELKEPETYMCEFGETVSVSESDKYINGYTFDPTNPDNILSTVADGPENILRLVFYEDLPPTGEYQLDRQSCSACEP